MFFRRRFPLLAAKLAPSKRDGFANVTAHIKVRALHPAWRPMRCLALSHVCTYKLPAACNSSFCAALTFDQPRLPLWHRDRS